MQGRRVQRRACAVFAVAIAALQTATPLPAQTANANSDIAYVDGMAGRSVADPARADGGGAPPAAAPPANPAADLQLAQQMAMQQAQMAQQQAGGPPQPPFAAPPATPAQQIGAGMAQDAASLLDAGVQRQVYGSQGAVYAPYPGVAPLPDGFAPSPLPIGP